MDVFRIEKTIVMCLYSKSLNVLTLSYLECVYLDRYNRGERKENKQNERERFGLFAGREKGEERVSKHNYL